MIVASACMLIDIYASASMLSVANAECHVFFSASTFMLIVIYGDCQVPVC